MRESLAEQIRTIEKIPGYVTIDKEKVIRELVEKRRRDNSLVEKTIRREISIPKEYKNLSKYIPGITPKIIPQADRNRCRELEDVVGGVGLDDMGNIYVHPATLTPALAIAAGGEYAVLEKIFKSKSTKREFLRGLGRFSIMGALMGSAVGIIPRIVAIDEKMKAEKNAAYVQSTIERLYK